MTAEKPHGHHAGHRWRTAPPEGEWWPGRPADDPAPTADPPPRLPRGYRDNLED